MDWGKPFRAIGHSSHAYWHGSGERKPWVRRTIAVIFAFLVPIPILLILIFRFVPIPGTPQMLLDLVTFNPVHYSWRSYDAIAPSFGQAVIGAEDQDFCAHHGFDWKEIDQAIRQHERHPKKALRGASTISQQTARSLFLVNHRSWVRKGTEAYLTVLIEALWPKKRILTAYLNVVDLGHGNYGVEAASESYFGKSADRLTPAQSARLAAILPDPDKWKAVGPGPYVSGRTANIIGRIGEVRRDGLDWCVKQ
ncbi:MAG TPA: monofunctional biosynthetic peptidoglycan transglycosylase [Rhizomicrobium sp.]|jgi:monofunctional biosynthetic peptidoglycan transglycosylase